jgi:PAS domain S-box-containing protein
LPPFLLTIIGLGPSDALRWLVVSLLTGGLWLSPQVVSAVYFGQMAVILSLPTHQEHIRYALLAETIIYLSVVYGLVVVWSLINKREMKKRQQADRALAMLHQDLERQVEDRTRELYAANQQLTREIAEREQAEEALRKSEERLRTAGRISYDLIYEWDVASDTLEWFGDIDGLLGFRKGEVSRDINAWLGLIHPEDRDKLVNAVGLHRTSTEPIQYEYRVRHKDGTYRHWEDHGLPLLDEKGRPQKWVGVCTDIESRKQADEKIRFLSAVVEQSTEGIAIAELDGKLTYVNDAWCRMHRYSGPDELLGKSLNIFHTEEQMEKEVKPFNERVMEFGTYGGELGHITKDGKKSAYA